LIFDSSILLNGGIKYGRGSPLYRAHFFACQFSHIPVILAGQGLFQAGIFYTISPLFRPLGEAFVLEHELA